MRMVSDLSPVLHTSQHLRRWTHNSGSSEQEKQQPDCSLVEGVHGHGAGLGETLAGTARVSPKLTSKRGKIEQRLASFDF